MNGDHKLNLNLANVWSVKDKKTAVTCIYMVHIICASYKTFMAILFFPFFPGHHPLPLYSMEQNSMYRVLFLFFSLARGRDDKLFIFR